MVWDEHRVVTKSLRPVSIRKEVTDSLRRLSTDYIDLYQFHWPDPETPIEESWKVMAELVREGKVRYIGLCNHCVDELNRCRSIADVQSLQPPYNMLNREVEKELLPYCTNGKIGVVAYSPMASGLLTGKFDFDKLAQDDWRRKSPRFGKHSRSKISSLLKELDVIAKRYNTRVGQLAVSWVLQNPAITSAVVGARKVWQIEEIAGASNINMSTDDYNSINQLLPNS